MPTPYVKSDDGFGKVLAAGESLDIPMLNIGATTDATAAGDLAAGGFYWDATLQNLQLGDGSLAVNVNPAQAATGVGKAVTLIAGAGAAGENGGITWIRGGTAPDTGTGGNLILDGGFSVSGTKGNIVIGSSTTYTNAVQIGNASLSGGVQLVDGSQIDINSSLGGGGNGILRVAQIGPRATAGTDIDILATDGTGAGTGGKATIYGGIGGGSNGTGGAVRLYAGAGGATDGDGANVEIAAGNASGTGGGGSILVVPGDGATDGRVLIALANGLTNTFAALSCTADGVLGLGTLGSTSTDNGTLRLGTVLASKVFSINDQAVLNVGADGATSVVGAATSGALYLGTLNSTFGATGNITVKTGNGGVGNSGSITIDVGTATATAGTINIGATATTVNIGVGVPALNIGNSISASLASGNSSNVRFGSANTDSGTTGSVTITSGNAGGTNNSGNVVIDTGTATGATPGVITIGNVYAGDVSIGRSGQEIWVDADNIYSTAFYGETFRGYPAGTDAITVGSADHTSTGTLTLLSGNASAGSSGNISMDVGTATGTTGTITIGGTNTSAIQIGRVGLAAGLQLVDGTQVNINSTVGGGGNGTLGVQTITRDSGALTISTTTSGAISLTSADTITLTASTTSGGIMLVSPDAVWDVIESPPYVPTNVTPDRAFDADTVGTAELADVLGTLISDLQNAGIIG